MINLIAFICSLCINFCAITPYNMADLNTLYEHYIDAVKSRISSNYNGVWGAYSDCLSVSNDRWIVICGATLWGSTSDEVTVLCPIEDFNNNISSSIICNSYTHNNDVVDSANLTINGYIQFFSVSSYVNNPYGTTQNFSFGSSSPYSLLYCSTPVYFRDTLVIDSFVSPPVLDFDGHATGWSDLLQEDSNGSIYTILGHSNNGIDNSNSFDLVSVSSGLTDKLLAAIGRLLSGINDSLSYGQGTLVGIGSLILTHIIDVKNWLFEPVDPDLLQDRWGHSSLGTLVNTINIDFNGHAYDPDDLVIRWNLSSIPYFDDCVGSFDLSSALDPTKYIWQPLLITLLYASLVWGFIRSIPNIIGGVSPISNNHIQAPKDTPKTSKGG